MKKDMRYKNMAEMTALRNILPSKVEANLSTRQVSSKCLSKSGVQYRICNLSGLLGLPRYLIEKTASL